MPCSPRAGRVARLPLTSGALQVKCTQQTFYEQGAESLTNKQQREVDIDTATPALKMKQQEAVAAIKPEEGRGSCVMELEVVFYAPGDKMGSPSRQHWLAVEIGVYGQEGKFETVKALGLIPLPPPWGQGSPHPTVAWPLLACRPMPRPSSGPRLTL